MALLFYQCLTLICLPLILIYHLLRGDTRKRLPHFYGLFREEFQGKFSSKGCDWFHAVSYGETLVIIEFIKMGLSTGRIQGQVLFTTTIENALTRFQDTFKKHPDAKRVFCCFYPLDFLPVLWLFFRRVNPRRFFLSETDFWPMLFWYLRKQGIPSYAINVRISSRLSYWYGTTPAMSRQLFRGFRRIFAQSQTDVTRLTEFTRKNVEVLGNAKFDLLSSAPLKEREAWIKSLNRQVICFGSFHKDEFKVIFSARSVLKSEDFLFLIAPRNLQDLAALKSRIKGRSESFSSFSKGKDAAETSDYLLLDEMGVLSRIYQVCSFTIIGGSFNKVGGHNPLEPMVYRRPVLVGPGMRNYADLVREGIKEGYLWQVKNSKDLCRLLSNYYKNPKPYIEGSLKAYRFVEKNQGTLQRSWEKVDQNP